MWHLFTYSKIPVFFHWSSVILFAIILFPFGSAYQFAFNLFIGTVIISSVILHEFGHSLMAQKYGYTVTSISIFALGGAAHIPRLIRPSPKIEFMITLAGPAINLVLMVVGMATHSALVMAGLVATGNQFFMAFWLINAMMGIFNLLPAFPMDGGRLLRAGLSKYMGHDKGTVVATTVAFVMAGIMSIIALYTMNIILLIIAAFVVFVSIHERKAAERGEMV